MSEQTGIPGELVYEYVTQFTQMVEYGASAEALVSGQTPPPAEWRFRRKGRRSSSSGRT